MIKYCCNKVIDSPILLMVHTTMSTEFEFVLSKTGRNNPITGNEGDARKIVQLLLQKDTFFNGGGVSIPSKSHMQATDDNLDLLRQEIDNKIRTNLPDIRVQDVQIKEFATNTYLIGIAIGAEQDPYTFGISFSNEVDPSKIKYNVIW